MTGIDLYPTAITNNVGIGLTTPNYILDVSGNTNIAGNFLIQQTSYTQPMTNNYQLGYTNTTTSVVSITSTISNIASITLPIAGVWIVEGQMRATFSSTNIYSISLSTTSATDDPTRLNVNYINSTNTLFGSNITSVFTATASTTVYLVGKLSGGGPTTDDSHSMTYTRIG